LRILGIDPGSRATGFGVIDKTSTSLIYVSCGVIRPKKDESFPHRLLTIYRGISEVIDAHHPDMASVEDVFMSVNARSALKLGQARGAAIVAAMERDLEVFEYSPRNVKQAVVGYGQAAKAQVQQMVRVLLNLRTTPSNDAADALALAICHAHRIPGNFS